jgi:hypothetical protein
MLDNCRAQPGQFPRSESSRPHQLHRLEPILGRLVAAFDMDVRRLAVFQAVEKRTAARPIAGSSAYSGSPGGYAFTCT